MLSECLRDVHGVTEECDFYWQRHFLASVWHAYWEACMENELYNIIKQLLKILPAEQRIEVIYEGDQHRS